MPNLFDPLTIRGTTFSNRAWVSPMCQYSAVNGIVGEWHRAHIGALATGGAGLIMMEATGVVPEGRISVGCTGIWGDKQADAFAPIVNFAHTMGRKIGIQLAHAGRKAGTALPWDGFRMATDEEGGWQSVAPSAIAYEGYPEPRALSTFEVKELPRAFAAAAQRALRIGFDVLEIHSAHGYLIHEFLSPLSNTRTDEYGGSFENRTRLLREVVAAVRAVMPTTAPLFVRISASDWVEGGWSIEETVEISPILVELGADLIDASSGGNLHNAPIKATPGYQVHFAAAIKAVGVATSAVGMITDPHQANEIISSGKADAVFLAREMIRNPRWPLHAAEALGVDIDWPLPMVRGKR